MRRTAAFVALACTSSLLLACGGGDTGEAGTTGEASATMSTSTTPTAIALWSADTPAYGMFVPSERAPGERDVDGNRMPPLYTVEGATVLADNPDLDYLFLNLEGAFDLESVKTLLAGLDASTTGRRPTLLVRVPTIEDAGADSTRSRVKEILALGADGVVIPHVRSVEEATLAISFFQEAGADVWTPANPTGSVIAMLMVEDHNAIAVLDEIAALPGYSMLSCGIGSLTGDMGGDREGAEAACLRTREAASAHGMPSMMTASGTTLADRLEKGYKGILLSGSSADASTVIRAGRAQ